MTNAWARLGVMIGLTLLFGLGGAAWAADCGDTSGPLGANVPCDCGNSVTTDTRLRPAEDPVCFDPVLQPGDAPCPVDGLIMNTDGVKLNLNECQIRGSETADSAGIRISAGVKDLEIRNNGPIIRFGTGIKTDGTTSGTTIRNTRIRLNTGDPGDGMNIAGDDNKLVANRVSQNDGHGIFLDGDNNKVLKNQARENGGTGIRVDGSDNDIDDNVARDNAGDGICVTNPGAPPNIDTGGNTAKGNNPTDCTFQCEIDGVPCI